MNFNKLFLLIIVFSLGMPAVAQGSSSTILVDKFGPIGCDSLRGQIDVFLSELRDNPGFEGLVINGGLESDKVSIAMREDMIRNHVAYRKFDLTRVKFARTLTNGIETQFWRTRPGESPPVRIEVGNEFTLPSIIQPLPILSDYGVDDLCPPQNYKKVFGLFLDSNPRARGNVVIRDVTPSASRKRRQEIRKYLVDQRVIDPSRVRFYLAKRTKPLGLEPVVEYWYIP